MESTVRTYKGRITPDTTLENLFTFVNDAASQATRKIMLCEQCTNRSWKHLGVEYPNYDTISELKKQYPKVKANDAKALWDYCVDKKFEEVQLCGVFSATARKDLGEFQNSYDRLVKVGFLPLYDLHTDTSVNRSIYFAICMRLSSFIACDKLTIANYNNNLDNFNKCIGKLSKTDATNLESLLAFAKSKFCTNDENVAQFLSEKFCAFLRHVYIPNPAAVSLTTGRYAYTTSDGKNKRLYYTPNADIMNFIASHAGLDNAIVKNYEAVELYDTIKRGKQNSRITIPDAIHSPVDIHFGINYINQKIVDIGGEYYIGDIGNKIFPQMYKLHYKKSAGQVYQMMNLKLTYAPRMPNKKKGKGKGSKGSNKDTPTRYHISFDVNGKHHIEGYLNEFSIQKRGEDYTVNFMFGDKFYSPLVGVYNSGIAKAKKKLDIIDGIIKKQKKIRCVGIDLGMNPNFGWSVVDSFDSLGQETKIVDTGVEGVTDYTSAYMQMYFSLGNAIRSFRQLLNMAKYHIEDENEVTEDTRSEVDELLRNIPVVTTDEVLQMLRDTTNKIVSIKKNWCYAKIRKHIMRIYGQMKDYRRKNNQTACPNEAIYMVMATNEYISILGKYNKIGYFNPNKSAHTETFAELWEYRDNIHDDTIKKLAYSVVAKAVEYKADFISVENLEMMLRGQKGGLANIFSYGEFKDKIQQTAAMYGVPVIEVDPTATSQIHPITGEWGYRDIKEFNGDFVAANGKHLESDGYVAATNIANRALRFHTDLKIITVCGDGTNWVPAGYGERIRGMLSLTKGDSFRVVDGKIVKNSKRDYPSNMDSESRFYLHDGKWLTLDEHKVILEKIKAKASGQVMKKMQ